MKHKITTIKVPFDNLERVYHISDIHIRLVKRHDEYRDVFQTLYEELLQSPMSGSVIFVAGDLVHAKTDLSPEMVGLASDFLKCLSEIAPTILIAGNHDTNLANPNRLDALSPIVDNIKNSNLHYLKDSGIYKVADTEFGVLSVFGDKKKWPSADQLSSKNKIALFHGPVNNAKTDIGYIITNRHVTPSLFAGYDIVMMGDIHKHQVLQEANPKLGKPLMVYGGSLIQQSHGEDISGHGYLVWNIPKRTFKFKDLHNVCGFHTLLIENGKMPDLTGIPDNVRLRLFVHNTDATAIKKISTMLRKQLNIQELTINRVIDSNLDPKDKSVITNFTDVKSVTFQNKLIRDYLEHHFAHVDEDTLSRIDEINAQLNSKIVDDDMSRNIHWRPLKFKFSNMFSYGEDNEINFEDMRGIYGLFSPNASGKTAALDALMFILFDKTPRAFKASHIMNNRKNKFECYIKFEVDGEIYGIKRVGTRNKKGDVKVDVEFWTEVNGDVISLNGEDRRSTNAHIRTYIGDYDDFILTNISVQNNGALFVDKSQSERKDLLGQFMGLDIFDKLHTIAADEMKETHGALKKFNRNDFTETLAQTQSDIEIQHNIFKNLEWELDGKTSGKNKLDEKVRKLYGEKIPLNITETNINKLQTKFEQFQVQSATADTEINELVDEFDQIEQRIKSVNSELSQFNIEKLESNVKSFNFVNKTYSSLTGDLKLLKSSLRTMEAKLQHLQEYEYDPNCKFCINNIFVKDARETENRIEAHREKVKNIEVLFNTAKEEVEQYSEALNEMQEYRDKVNELASLETTLQRTRAEIFVLRGNKSDLSTKIVLVQDAIDKYNSSIDIIESNEKLQEKIDELEIEKELISSEIVKVEKTLRKTHGEIEVLKSNKREMIKAIRDAEELEETYAAYEYYISAINRDGVPYELISKVIPNIESEINNILTQIVDFTVLLEIDGKNINGKLVYDMDKVWPLELSSGMERFISSLAIRVALLNVSNLPKSNFLVVDEGLGTLDADNLSSMSMMFGILKAQFDWIILISHLDSVRDIVENLIDIKRDNGYSQIQIM